MTSSIPDKISTTELADILSEMQHEENCISDKDIIDCAENHIDQMLDEIHTPLVHKVAALMIMKRFVEWHNEIANSKLNSPDSVAWAEDMGKLKAAAQLFASVEIGSDDFVAKDLNC